MRYAAIILTLAASLAYGAEQTAMERTFTLPHALAAGTNAWLEVQVGPLAHGQRVRVTTQTGEPIGAIAPFGPAQRQRAGVYSLPVPADAIHDDVLGVIVTITTTDGSPRAPTAAEVQSPKLQAPGIAR